MRPSLLFGYNNGFNFVIFHFILLMKMKINSEKLLLLIFKLMGYLSYLTKLIKWLLNQPNLISGKI